MFSKWEGGSGKWEGLHGCNSRLGEDWGTWENHSNHKTRKAMENYDPKKPYDLNKRIKAFVLEIFEFVEELPNTAAARNVRNQLVRCAPSVGANYRASKRGRSGKEYIAKLGIAEEEADETCYWLDLCSDANWDVATPATRLLKEADEITAIIVTLIKRGKERL